MEGISTNSVFPNSPQFYFEVKNTADSTYSARGQLVQYIMQNKETGSATLGLDRSRHHKLVDDGRFHLYSGNTVEALPLLPKQCKWEA